jgi:F0F1-type ATP synthase membrane subunit b/b'
VSPEIQQNVAALAERMSHIEEGLDGARKRTAELHDLVAQDMQSLEKTLQGQSVSIESARTAMAQTDDLVERVVDALESLESLVLEKSGER